MLTVDGRSITSSRWFPGRIVGGLATALRGVAAEETIDRRTALRSCTGLSSKPAGR